MAPPSNAPDPRDRLGPGNEPKDRSGGPYQMVPRPNQRRTSFQLDPARCGDRDFEAASHCNSCAIQNTQQVKESIERYGWANRGGEEAREKFYKTCAPYLVLEFRRQDAMRQTQLRLYNEAAGANNRTCDVINYFKCPYGDERGPLTEDGYQAEKLWKVVEWYDAHWNPNSSTIPAEQQRKWYHQNEPSILDVTNLEDILQADDDGRIQKIAEEQQQYRKENPG